ncbi:hypothetical protein [Methylobacterium isbiliense]|uniref:Uncharacterized protein n=1 Tax=Methylobacterium isbiliense TaxID=315478 RepID=A0ABQ4SA22_9HYPH|nr:hypothetical protein [Methylobacterium isbiliense]MDN3625580.1 hypothetical protein [Methylobacterium isbiliense]GJE00015.1 hypothetical protein GMJLKIPL_1933 [Methylobacterium isbiliense]
MHTLRIIVVSTLVSGLIADIAITIMDRDARSRLVRALQGEPARVEALAR